MFLCTGNYYRSRFAEGLFNHLAGEAGLRWRARSRGLDIDHTREMNLGPISPLTLGAFRRWSIPIPESIAYPQALTVESLRSAGLIIALKEAEHRAMIRETFPDWEHRVTYWHVHDLDQALPEVALAEIETLVRALLDQLGAEMKSERGNSSRAQLESEDGKRMGAREFR
jgi:protein-tyrosine phosphatase